RGVSGHFTLDFKVPVLRVGRNVIVDVDSQTPIGRGNDERRCLRCAGREWNRQSDGCERRVRIHELLQTVVARAREIDSRYSSDRGVHLNEIAEGALIGDAVSGAKHRFAFTKPRYIPCKADGWCEVVQVVSFQVGQDIGVRRVLAHKLYLNQIATGAVEGTD